MPDTLADSDECRSRDARGGTADGAPPMPELATETPKVHAFLLALSDRLRVLDDPEQIQFESVAALGRTLGAQRVGYAEDCGDGATGFVGRHHADGVPALEGRYRYADHGPELLRELQAGRPLVRPDIAHDAALDEPTRRTQAALRMGATLHLPLLQAGRLVALLFVHYREARPGLAAELPLAESVASRTWEAVQRARAAAALRLSEEKYRTLVARMAEGFALCELLRDADGRAVDCRCLEVNHTLERLTGLDRAQLEGCCASELLPGEVGPWVQAGAAAVERGESGRFEYEVRALERCFDVKVAPHGGARFTLFFDDITERKRTEAALRVSEDRLRKAISIDTVGVLFFSLDGRVLDANAAFERLTGFAVDELRRGVHWQTLTPPEHLAATQRAAEELATRGETAPYEKEFLRKDGSRFWGLFAPTRLSDSGPAAECVEFIIDISAAKQVDRALREADRNKDEFLATLAHELRNPLAPLANGLHLVRLAGADNPRLQRTVEIMDRQLGHVVRLVDDLLDVARISMGKIELQRERVGLSEVIALAIEGMQAPLQQREQVLEVMPSRAELYVEGDRLRLTQVFSNLLSNALKYTQPGGRIQVRIDADGDQAAVSVSDTGIGIPGWALPHVFDLFSQVRIHQEQSEGGLGLGLSLVRSLVALHGGTVSAASEGPGRGSTFTVRLPRVDGQWPSIHDSGHGDFAAPQPSGLHVLVADDNQDAAITLASLLEFEGHHVQVAFDGEQAVASAQAQPPDVAFLDLGMPHMDGVEAARRLRGLERDRHMLIVALTGWGQDKDRDRTRAAGFDAHLVKPPRLADLVDLMKRARH
jgi:PAS domain S-box-containing protein